MQHTQRAVSLAKEDFAEVDVGAVVLKMNAGGFGAEVGFVFEFTFLKAGFPVVTALFDLEDLFSVHPMLDMIVLGEDAAGIPLAGGFGWFVGTWSNEIVEGGDG